MDEVQDFLFVSRVLQNSAAADCLNCSWHLLLAPLPLSRMFERHHFRLYRRGAKRSIALIRKRYRSIPFDGAPARLAAQLSSHSTWFCRRRPFLWRRPCAAIRAARSSASCTASRVATICEMYLSRFSFFADALQREVSGRGTAEWGATTRTTFNNRTKTVRELRGKLGS